MSKYFETAHEKWMYLASKARPSVWFIGAVCALLLAYASHRDGTRLEWMGAALMCWSMACVGPLTWAQRCSPSNGAVMSLRFISMSASVGLAFAIIGIAMLIADIVKMVSV